MADIARKTTGMLIDELFTTSMKCWFAQETITGTRNAVEVAIAAKKAQKLNARRNELIRAIDKNMGEETASPTPKTYT